MPKYHLTKAEYNLMEIVWECEPIISRELVEKCAIKFQWKKSTTYTNLKKLVDKKMVLNCDSIVKALISKSEYETTQRKEIIKNYFSDSLPQFLLAFIQDEELSREEIQELEDIIDEYKGGLDD